MEPELQATLPPPQQLHERPLSYDQLPPPPEFQARPVNPNQGPAQSSRRRFCVGIWGPKECKCCSPPVLRPTVHNGTVRSLPVPASGDAMSAGPKKNPCLPFVDTHVHLEEVLQEVLKYEEIPSLSMDFDEMDEEQRLHWYTIGWGSILPTAGGADDGGGAIEGSRSEPAVGSMDDGGGGADDGAGGSDGSPPRKRKRNTWQDSWSELTSEQQKAAESLGWTPRAWNRNYWHLPRKTAWRDLSSDFQHWLTVLGEDAESWDTWNGTKFTKIDSDDASPSSRQSFGKNAKTQQLAWKQLSVRERAAAVALGFTEKNWGTNAMADLTTSINRYFGAGFRACITQGCDEVSIDYARELCLAHPQVFASFGCHPKGCYTYNDELEQRLLRAMEECGPKAVAWGEFGLDYSHPDYGRLASNRRLQKELCARQLKLAVSRGYPLVLHSRGADRDTLRMMRQYVPRNWKVHMHSFRGSIQTLEAMLVSWNHVYVGFSGLTTIGDSDVEELCRRCPLERMLLETDGPYLPVNMAFYSHPGQIPEIAAKVAELQGGDLETVMQITRANAFTMYGV